MRLLLSIPLVCALSTFAALATSMKAKADGVGSPTTGVASVQGSVLQGVPAETARTTFFSMGLGIGGGSYSGKYENGTEIKGSGLMIVSSLQGGFFVNHSLAIGAGGAFLYMPSPKGERTDTKGNVSTNGSVDAAPGGFIGPALRYYVSDGFQLSVVVGYGGLGSSGVFGGTGPAIAPSLGFAIYRNAHFQLGIDGHLYVMPLSSAHESGTFVGAGALLSLAYL